MYPNIEEDNVELAQLNAEIDKVKKQLAARQSKYEEVPQPKTQVGWSSYIVNNDRGMLDKYQDAERQWYNLKEQERHAKELAEEQARNAKELADKQRTQQDMMNMDENMKNRSIAAINYQYAKQARDMDKTRDPAVINMLDQKLAEAKATLDYWNKRTGMVKNDVKKELNNEVNEEVKSEAEEPMVEPQGTTLKVDISDYKAITTFDTEKDKKAVLNKIKNDPAFNTDDSLRNEYNRLSAIKTKEAINAARADKLKKDQAVYSKLSKIEKANYLDEHPEYDSVDGKLKYKNK